MVGGVQHAHASRATAAWLRAWDRAPRPNRERMLQELIREHAGQTAPEIERKLGVGASLLFTRLVSWLRLSQNSGANVATQLRAISLFICAPSAERFRAEFSAVGGIQTVIDTIALPQESLPPPARREALSLLTGVARASREHKVAICELRASAAIVAFMHGCGDDLALDAARELLVTLASANPPFVHEVHSDALDLLASRENARAQLFGASAVREILAELSFDELYREGAGERRALAESVRSEKEAAARQREREEAEERALAEDGEEGGEEEEAAPAADSPPSGNGDIAALLLPGAAGLGAAERRARRPRRSVRPSVGIEADAVEAAARAAAVGSDCVLGPEYAEGVGSLLCAFSAQAQREGCLLALLLAEHPSLHAMLLLLLKRALLDGRTMHAQAAAAKVVGQLLSAGGGAPPGVDEFSALAEHEASLSADILANRVRFAERLEQAEVVPLVCLLLLHARSSECRRQAAVSLQLIVRHGSPAAAAAVQRYASPVFDELLADPFELTAMPLEEAVAAELAALLARFVEMQHKAAQVRQKDPHTRPAMLLGGAASTGALAAHALA